MTYDGDSVPREHRVTSTREDASGCHSVPSLWEKPAALTFRPEGAGRLTLIQIVLPEDRTNIVDIQDAGGIPARLGSVADTDFQPADAPGV